MTRNELISGLMSAGLYKGQWGSADDVEYSTLSEGFVREALSAFVDWLPPELVEVVDGGGGRRERRPKWLAEVGDCDNIAKAFLVYLTICTWRDAAMTSKRWGNVAAGQLNFIPDAAKSTEGHAIVWWFDHEQRLHVVDPGWMRIDHLTTEQIGSSYGGGFA